MNTKLDINSHSVFNAHYSPKSFAAYDFDDLDTPQGFYLWIMRDYDRRFYLSPDWWHCLHPDLGCSPLSALCNNRFIDVHQCAIRRKINALVM